MGQNIQKTVSRNPKEESYINTVRKTRELVDILRERRLFYISQNMENINISINFYKKELRRGMFKFRGISEDVKEDIETARQDLNQAVKEFRKRAHLDWSKPSTKENIYMMSKRITITCGSIFVVCLGLTLVGYTEPIVGAITLPSAFMAGMGLMAMIYLKQAKDLEKGLQDKNSIS